MDSEHEHDRLVVQPLKEEMEKLAAMPLPEIKIVTWGEIRADEESVQRRGEMWRQEQADRLEALVRAIQNI